MKIVLISGKAEAGKTTVSRYLKNLLTEYRDFSVACVPYGNYVKDTAEDLWEWDGKKDAAGRTLLQWWGTDCVRSTDPDFWAETVARLASVIKDKFQFMIIDDARFINELLIWKGYEFEVITVRIERPGHENALTPEQRLHISETELDNWDFDVVLTALNQPELYRQVITKLIPKLIGEELGGLCMDSKSL